jgi:hypothetical protein
MDSPYFIAFVAVISFLAAGCCAGIDCFPATKDADAISFQFASFEAGATDGFLAHELANFYVIKTEKNDLNAGIDTVFKTPIQDAFGLFMIGPNASFKDTAWADYGYVIQNDDPYFRHTLTDIQVSGEFDDSGCCTTYRNTKKIFKLDGKQTTKSELPLTFTK